MTETHLGSSCDDALFDRLLAAVEALGGTMEDSEWCFGKATQSTTYRIVLPQGELEAFADTDAGISLRGEDALVGMLSERVLGQGERQ